MKPRRPAPAPAPASARGRASGAARAASADAGPAPLDDREIDELQALLDALPAPLEPFDVSALDGFLCGMLVQPGPVPRRDWLSYVEDSEGRAVVGGAEGGDLPQRQDAPPRKAKPTDSRLHALVLRREAELRLAIEGRRWFDPWVFELASEPGAAAASPDETVLPWVVGFAAALEAFPALMAQGGAELNEPLALVFRHLDPDDLEDADELLAEIDATEPPDDLPEAVEQLVRATLLLADAAASLRRA